MKVLIFGGTGLVGQGILRECLLDPNITHVTAVGRHSVRQASPKLREMIVTDLHDREDIWSTMDGFDVAFFCIGRSSLGVSKETYRRITYDLTLSIAAPLASANPAMTFLYISAAGARADGRANWARTKGETERALASLPFRALYCFRPAYVQATNGAASRTAWYRIIAPFAARLTSGLARYLPQVATSAEQIGRAALLVAGQGFPRQILENRDINEAALSRPDRPRSCRASR